MTIRYIERTKLFALKMSTLVELLNTKLSLVFVNNYVGSARGVMVIVVGNEHGNTSSNPGRD